MTRSNGQATPESQVTAWDAVADRITGDVTGARYELVWRMLRDPAGPLLEIGCGQGHMLRRARGAGLEPVGMDISPRALAAAREGAAAGVPLVAADARFLPFPSERFGTATMTEVIEHVPDPGMALREAFRVLRAGGQIAITAPTSFHRFMERVGVYRSFQPYDEALAIPDLLALLKESGFVRPRVRLVPVSAYTSALAYFRGRLRPDAPARGPMPRPVAVGTRAIDAVAGPLLKGVMKVLPTGVGGYFARMALVSAWRP